MNKIKKISKYTVNTLNIINALLLGINSVEGIIEQVQGLEKELQEIDITYATEKQRVASIDENIDAIREVFIEFVQKAGEDGVAVLNVDCAETRKLIDSVPCIIKKDLNQQDALKIKQKLELLGAKVLIRK